MQHCIIKLRNMIIGRVEL